jgi:tRNA (guanine37-N1)-methyltransferase
VEESFSQALGGDPEYPHYTRPADYRGWRVPDVLLSGHHQEIRTWRRLRSRERGVVGPTARPPDPEDGGGGTAPGSSGPDPFGPMPGDGSRGGGPDPFGPMGQ